MTADSDQTRADATTGSARADAAAAISDRRRAALLGALAVVVMVLVGLVTWQWTRLSDENAIEDARSQLRAQAGTIVAQVLSRGTYWDADRIRARGLVTDAYARRNELDKKGPGLVTDYATHWKPTTVAIVDADATSGTVLIDGNSIRVIQAAPSPTPQTLSVQFVSIDGRWLVDQIDVVR
ncbi:hypothetical protein GOEFS_091_00240 [Gordonia effusa NBRC 100432]|uniref:Mce-associated membrane protein n=1 Tax=Gordonia effusa NBRC 100432 TaxID=1077974 RepID=H0R381_9ACTN|nr:hypothetical protein [Gordonia effusa]GAB19532.1 hypothetical protein GOEFS_091_00240 [Gordonia effusa NBRC 100432]